MLLEIIGGAVIIFGIIALIYSLERQGRTAERKDQLEQVLDDIHKADRARDNLLADPDAANRLRDRFTR